MSFSAPKMSILTVFGQFYFQTKMYFVVFGFLRFQPKTHPFSDENVHLDSLQSIWQRRSKRIKWDTSVAFIVTVDG